MPRGRRRLTDCKSCGPRAETVDPLRSGVDPKVPTMKITLTLKLKFLSWTLLLVLGVIAFGIVSVSNLVSLRRVAQATTAAYDAMDRADATVIQVAWLRDALRSADSTRYRDPTFFAPIRKETDEIVR